MYCSAESFTPQRRQLPSFVINTGFKKEFLNWKLVLIATVSDVFISLRNRTIIDTSQLYKRLSGEEMLELSMSVLRICSVIRRRSKLLPILRTTI